MLSVARKAIPALLTSLICLGVISTIVIGCKTGSRDDPPVGTGGGGGTTPTIAIDFTVTTTSVTSTDQVVTSNQIVGLVFSMAYQNSTSNVTIDQLQFDNTGSIDESIFTAGAALYEDTNGDERPDGAALATVGAIANDGTLTFTPTGITLTGGAAARTFLVCFDGTGVTPTATMVGQTIIMNLPTGSAPDITTTPGSIATTGNPSFAQPNPANVSLGIVDSLVINELDYDTTGLDNQGREFVELYNGTGATIPLAGKELYFVNGSSTGANYAPGAPVDLSTAGASMPPNSYLVVADNPTTLGLTAGPMLLVINTGGAGNMIQNDPSDGMILYDTNTDTVLDAVCYEGAPVAAANIDGFMNVFNAGETAAGPTDAAANTTDSIGRSSVSADTDDNSVDFTYTVTGTPGAQNP